MEVENMVSTLYFQVTIALASFVVYVFYKRYGSGLSKYPGPFLASVTNWWRVYDVTFNRNRPPLVDLHKKYGTIVRYGPNMLSFSDPRAVKDIYIGANAFPKSEFYTMGDFAAEGKWHSSMFTSLDQKYHSKMRRGFGAAFTMSTVAKLEKYVDATIEVFIDVMARRFVENEEKNNKADVAKWNQYFAFDVLGQLLYGQRHGFLESGTDVEGIIGTADAGMRYSFVVGQVPWLNTLLKKNSLLLWLETKGFIGTPFPVVPFAMKHVEERRGRDQTMIEHEGDLLSRMLALKEKDPAVLNDFEVVNVCAMLVFAGSDTISATISAFYYYILKNPAVYRGLLAEIDAAIPSGETRISFSEAQALPYLDACLKETLRMHPAAGFNSERVVPAGGRKILDEFIPGGTIVVVNGWAVHRNQTFFGEDADTFRPERWLENKEKTAEMKRYLLHFGAGAHVCLGQNIALLELYKVIPVFLRTFEIQLEDPEMEWKIENMTIVNPVDFALRLKRR